MNWFHRRYCRSDRWRGVVKSELLPWALRNVELGAEVLEVGPGPGITTEILKDRVERLTCVEIDRALAESLAGRMAGTNVRVLCNDAASMPIADGSFDSAVCFTMLHHLPSASLQDRLLREVARVLRPGGVFAGSDSRISWLFRLIHLGDTMVVVDPATFAGRLEAAGFRDVRIDVARRAFRFRALRA